ncbi:alpha/beta hydrolase [Streptomyces sp. B1866]|uniref:alpha/beta fold hydrolase n=1 Tax=Streptomyces sp. B1866 TaxID=3075431 RepID=UPI002891B520|nr:alpha/beta hydrolase [Streptomyces sp. B1866]MDT3397350.1 alpha/beta hydrolase [Streptomyces sp. B1866]
MARVTANGVDLHVQRLPARPRPDTAPPTVVFLHGAFIDSLASYYFTLAPDFAAAGFDTVMYDLRGHGRSERPRTGYTLEDFSADLDELLDQLGIHHPVHLVGNSFGGTLALDFAAHRPDRTASVVVVESGPATPQWASAMSGALHETTEARPPEEALDWFVTQYGSISSTRSGDPQHDAHIARLGRAAGTLISSTTIATDIHSGRTLTDDQLRELSCPVLLINGSEGLVAEQAAWLEDLLPRCEVAVVPGQKHSVLVEASDEVCDLALEWISAHEGMSGRKAGAR